MIEGMIESVLQFEDSEGGSNNSSLETKETVGQVTNRGKQSDPKPSPNWQRGACTGNGERLAPLFYGLPFTHHDCHGIPGTVW